MSLHSVAPSRGRRLGVIVMSLIFVGGLFIMFSFAPMGRASTLRVGGIGVGNHTTIQEAIDAAFPGDVIFVYNGTYSENVQVNKPLSLRGETRDNTIIDGGGIEDAIYVSADWVNITGFTIAGGTGPSGINAGIELDSVENCTVIDNNISNNDYGIVIYSSTNITISNNAMFENGVSIWGDLVEQWNSHTIDITNTVNGKPVYYWKDANGGIIPPDAGQVILVNCTDVTVENQNLSNGTEGLGLSFSSGNTVVNNTASYNERYGIFLQSSHSNTISNNRLSHNAAGLYLWHSDHNTIAHNLNISNSSWGIFVVDSSNNQIHHNNLVDNNHQANDETGTNEWNSEYPSGGNYWSDYTDIDEKNGPLQDQPGSDGFWDNPYVLLSGASKDQYPLTIPVGVSPPSAPSEPKNLEANAGSQYVTLTWEAPVDDGGSVITGYVIYRGTAAGGETFLTETGHVLTYADTGLENGQTYHYKVSARNAIGREGAMSNGANATPTNQAPTCDISTPLSGSDVSGTSTITGTSSDSDGTVESVEIRIDSGSWIQAVGTTSWSYDWNTTEVPNGEHMIFARAYDGANYSEEVSVSVEVDNILPPPPNEIQVLEQVWFWVLVAVVIVILLMLFIVLRKRKEGPGKKD